ncbi:MAG: SRPBCC family protein [Elusimicrobiota bacterium]|jgi:ribosome-associated toxin RatA of RatAB toxin-antitoxin module
MNTSNVIEITAPYGRLFRIAADVTRWPEILPHYRWVKVLQKKGNQITVEMAARHKGLPLWWRAIQRPLPEEKRILFTHIGGITKGMEVQWIFQQVGETPGGQPVWSVQIHHQFEPKWPPPGPWLAERIIGEMFVKQVAQKTLKRIKELIEVNP